MVVLLDWILLIIYVIVSVFGFEKVLVLMVILWGKWVMDLVIDIVMVRVVLGYFDWDFSGLLVVRNSILVGGWFLWMLMLYGLVW